MGEVLPRVPNVTDLFPCWRLKDTAELCCLWVFRHLPAMQMTTENHRTRFLTSPHDRRPRATRVVLNTVRVASYHRQDFKLGM